MDQHGHHEGKEGKCKILSMGWNNSTYQYMLGCKRLESSLERNTWGPVSLQVDHEPVMHPCGKQDQWHPRLY